MQNDADLMRNGKPWLFTNFITGKGIKEVIKFLEDQIPIA